MVNVAMEAIHEVLRMLINWEHHDLAEGRIHPGCFPSARWPGAPDLVAHFNEKLKDIGYVEDSG